MKVITPIVIAVGFLCLIACSSTPSQETRKQQFDEFFKSGIQFSFTPEDNAAEIIASEMCECLGMIDFDMLPTMEILEQGSTPDSLAYGAEVAMHIRCTQLAWGNREGYEAAKMLEKVKELSKQKCPGDVEKSFAFNGMLQQRMLEGLKQRMQNR